MNREGIPPDDPKPDPVGRTFRLGVWLFLASLSALLGGSLVAYSVIRFGAPRWPPAGYPGPPRGLWVSTLIILLVSFAAHRSLKAIRRGDRTSLRNGLVLTGLLLAAFLVSQTVNGVQLLHAVGEGRKKDLFAFTFFLLTGLHALHILGGFVPLGIATVRAFLGRYDRHHYSGVWGIALYLHFLDAFWLAMFLLLMF